MWFKKVALGVSLFTSAVDINSSTDNPEPPGTTDEIPAAAADVEEQGDGDDNNDGDVEVKEGRNRIESGGGTDSCGTRNVTSASSNNNSARPSCHQHAAMGSNPPPFVRRDTELTIPDLGRMTSMAVLKNETIKNQSILTDALSKISSEDEDKESRVAALNTISITVRQVWTLLGIGDDLAYALSDFLRENGGLSSVADVFVDSETDPEIRHAAGLVLEECLSNKNIDYLISKSYMNQVILKAIELTKLLDTEDYHNQVQDNQRLSVVLISSSFRHSVDTSANLIQIGALDHLLDVIKRSSHLETHRHAAIALANLSLYSDSKSHPKMMRRNVLSWLFVLAANNDPITRYYAFIARCMLAVVMENEETSLKSDLGTLKMVEPFLLEHSPESLGRSTFHHSKYRPKEWLKGLMPMLTAKVKEARSLAAYHFAMEAGIKAQEDERQIFQEIGAISHLREVAGVPDEIASGFAGMALEIIGEEVPYKLTQQVPLWTIQDVSQWVKQIGFSAYSDAFEEQMVDGDMLLLITEDQLRGDIQMISSLLRQRFMRELDHLKIAADYSSIDTSKIDKLLGSIHPKFSAYTYRILHMDLDASNLRDLNESLLSQECAVANPIHRKKILEACKGVCQHDLNRGELVMPAVKEDVDIFISYRRSTGSQLASLIRVMLKLKGYKVFIDVDRLSAGVFDASLLHHIRAAAHFLLILSPHSMDRCVQDDLCEDWVHKEILCALECGRNIIPVLDPKFSWPAEEEGDLPEDIRDVKRFNAVNWIHEYQEACLEKVMKFLNDHNAKAATSNNSNNNTNNNTNSSTTSSVVSNSNTGGGNSGGAGTTTVSSPGNRKMSRTGSKKLLNANQHQSTLQQHYPSPSAVSSTTTDEAAAVGSSSTIDLPSTTNGGASLNNNNNNNIDGASSGATGCTTTVVNTSMTVQQQAAAISSNTSPPPPPSVPFNRKTSSSALNPVQESVLLLKNHAPFQSPQASSVSTTVTSFSESSSSNNQGRCSTPSSTVIGGSDGSEINSTVSPRPTPAPIEIVELHGNVTELQNNGTNSSVLFPASS